MATTYPLPTVAAVVTPAGISSPSFADILASYQASVRAIFGSDIYIEADSKDGQMLAMLAQAQYDSNLAAIAVYNSYNPQTATGVALDGAVKVNGIRRQSATFSTVELTLIGTAGTQILRGVAVDVLNQMWDLPDIVTIPSEGTITVTATAALAGAVTAAAHTVNTMFTQFVGWQSVDNLLPASLGNPIETDGQLRLRQEQSTSNLALTTAESLIGRVGNVPGVSRVSININDTDTTDVNGIPSHSFSMVVEGGDINAIALAIEQAKDVGAGTFGNITVNVTDPAGLIVPISFQRLTDVPVAINVQIHELPNSGFQGATLAAIRAAVLKFVNALGIGADVYLKWVEATASLGANPTFTVVGVTQGTVASGTLTAADIVIPFDSAATLLTDDLTIEVV